MVIEERDSGIGVIGRVPWGTHFCFFFETGEDLASALVPFFEAGLKNNEYCICVTSEPLDDGAFKKAMRDAVPGFDEYLDKGQIEFIPYGEWYYDNGTFNLKKAFNGWLKKLQVALASGYDGIRVTGSLSWLKRENWKEFIEYENEVNDTIGNSKMLAICTYPLDACDAGGIVGAVSAHQFALVKQNGEFKLIENSELKETKNALRESEEKLRSFFDLPLIGMALTSPEKGWIYANDRICEILEFSREELFQLAWDKITHPDDLDNDLEHFNRLLSGDIDSYTIEKRFMRKDGRIVHTQISVGCVRNPDNSVRYIAGLMQDITERKRAEEAVKLANAYNRSLIEASLDPLVTISPDGRITDVNKATEKVTGLSREQLIGTDFSNYFTDPEKAKEGYLKAFKEGSVTDYPLDIMHKDGHLTPIIYNASVYRSEASDVIGVFAAARDISEQKKIEDARLRLAAIVDSSDDAIIGKTLDGLIISWNAGAVRLFGYSEDEAVGRSISILATPDYPDEIPYILEKIRHGEHIDHYETIRKRKDGKIINVSLSVSPIKDSNGRLVGASTITRDITEKKRAEEELKAAKQQAELYLDLMGHDINNLHQIALGYLELARDMPAEGVQRDYLDKPVEVLQRSAKLISNVRKLQKLHDGVFQDQDVDVCQVLSDVRREFRAVPDKTITLNLNGFERCHVLANELLHDVFSNLVGNAVKHTGDRAAIVVDLDVVEDNGGRYCRVAVEDDGPGIPDDFKAKIFNRALKSTAKAKGMGLGLYLVKSLVDSYGGRVWVEDRIKGDHTKGARFVVMLPAVDK